MWAFRRNQRVYFFPLRSHRCSLADDCWHTVCGMCQLSSAWTQRSLGESSWQLHYGTGLCFSGLVHGHRTPERWRQMPAQCLTDWTCSAEEKGANVHEWCMTYCVQPICCSRRSPASDTAKICFYKRITGIFPSSFPLCFTINHKI